MSNINTTAIDVNYPVPGVNNNSRGFRTNFTSIKNNLDVASTEITDLQNKAVLKSPLTNSVINNDMANTLISNAAVRSFRSTTYNLGNALSGTVTINASLADIHYGTVAGNVTLDFSKWAPADTQQLIALHLTFSNREAVISFPNTIEGAELLENYREVANVGTIVCPPDTDEVRYVISTADCGVSLYPSSTIRPFQSTQIRTRTPPSTGELGDKSGSISVDAPVSQFYVVNTFTTGSLFESSEEAPLANLYLDMPVVFTGDVIGTVTAGTTYYVSYINIAGSQFSVSATPGGANITIGDDSGNMKVNPVTYMYRATGDYNANTISRVTQNTWTSVNYVTLSDTTGLEVNAPIIFEGNVFGGLIANIPYYIKTIEDLSSSPGNITVSRSRNNGVAGRTEPLTTADPGGNVVVACAYIGSDIFMRMPFTPY